VHPPVLTPDAIILLTCGNVSRFYFASQQIARNFFKKTKEVQENASYLKVLHVWKAPESHLDFPHPRRYLGI